MLSVYYKYFYSYNAGVDFARQNLILVEVDPRVVWIKTYFDMSIWNPLIPSDVFSRF